jgi:4-hydroxythreonine-4-phosphate dehydrogenase
MAPLKTVLITAGDPAGIGPEIALKTLRNSGIRKMCTPVVVGSVDVLDYYRRKLGMAGSIRSICRIQDARRIPKSCIPVINTGPWVGRKVRPGRISAIYGRAALSYIDFAARQCLDGCAHGMVTCPICKESVVKSGVKGFKGHTEYLVHMGGDRPFAMTLYEKQNRSHLAVAHISTHLPLNRALKLVRARRIQMTAKLLHAFFTGIGVKNPVLAVPGLNPHAGENGLFGREEKSEIIPAIKRLKKSGMRVKGPVSPDVVFANLRAGLYHGVVALYHDQGHIPLKSMFLHLGKKARTRGVNVTIGLPFIRTSVDHGTGFDIAGRGKADENSLLQAVELAVMMRPSRIRRN